MWDDGGREIVDNECWVLEEKKLLTGANCTLLLVIHCVYVNIPTQENLKPLQKKEKQKTKKSFANANVLFWGILSFVIFLMK